MVENNNDTIILSGISSIEFADSYFRPSKELINHFSDVINRVDEEIVISRNGCVKEADIADLDLSFIDNVREEVQISIDMIFEVNIADHCYTTVGAKNSEITVVVSKSYEFCDSFDCRKISYAA